MAEHLDYTTKRLAAFARERDVRASLRWRLRVKLTYGPKQLVLVDESASNCRTLTRRVGKSKRGTIAKTNRYFLHCGQNHSALGPFVLDQGFLDIDIVEGAYNSETFLYALIQKVVRRHIRTCSASLRIT